MTKREERWMKRGIYPVAKKPELYEAEDGSAVIFASKKLNDKVRAEHPGLDGKWVSPDKDAREMFMGYPIGHWRYPRHKVSEVVRAYGIDWEEIGDWDDLEKTPLPLLVSEYALHKRITWAQSQDIPGPMKYALLTLAICFDSKVGYCRYSVKALTSRMGISPATFHRAIKKLEAEGLIAVQRLHRKPNHYLLDIKP